MEYAVGTNWITPNCNLISGRIILTLCLNPDSSPFRLGVVFVLCKIYLLALKESKDKSQKIVESADPSLTVKFMIS